MRAGIRAIVLFFFAASAWAQLWVNIKPGAISYAEGPVYLDEVLLRFRPDQSHEVRKGQCLRTGRGRAEMQLGLAATLWLGEQSNLRMGESTPTNIQLFVDQGSIYVEVIEKYENLKIEIRVADAIVELKEIGSYRVDCTPPRLRVNEGLAQISRNQRKVKVKPGKSAELIPLKVRGFDNNPNDSLYIWASQRSNVLYGRIKQERDALLLQLRMADLIRQRQIEDGVRREAYSRIMQDQANEAQRLMEQQRAQQPPPGSPMPAGR